MCGIEKNLSNHKVARHTFGNMAGDKIDPRMLQKLYRHSNLKTIGYQANFIHKDADDALEKSIEFINFYFQLSTIFKLKTNSII